MTERLRTGRKVGRTIYIQYGPEPSDDDPLIGVMDSPVMAARIVAAFNGETTKLCALPNCTRAAVSVGFCSVEHSEEHTDFRRWLSEREGS